MWNPFKKQETSASSPAGLAPAAEIEAPRGAVAAQSSALLAEIVRVRSDTLGQDLRPMQRLIRDTTFILPLLEPVRQTEQGTIIRFMTLENDEITVAFTDAARVREFFGGENPLGGTQMAVTHVSGRTLCEMAQRAGLRKIILNPNSDILFALHPLVYGAIAQGLVIGHIADEEIHSEEIAVGDCVAGPPNAEVLATFQAILGDFGAREAFWCALFLPPDEMRFALGVEIAPEQFEALSNQLRQSWIGPWPLPTPLHVLALGEAKIGESKNSARDAAIRQTLRIF